MVLGEGSFSACFQVFTRDIVDRDEACFATCFDGHIRNGKTLVHAQALDCRATELHRLIECAINTDKTDDVQDDILTSNARIERALDVEKDRFGNLEPRLASCKAHARIGRANTGRERTERAIRAGMAIGTDDQIACANDPLFGQERMLDTHAAYFVIVRDALFACEIAYGLRLLSALDVLVGSVVIGNERDLRGIEHAIDTDLLELLDSDRRSDVVCQHQIQIAFDKLPRNDLIKAGVGGKDLFSHGHRTCHMRSFSCDSFCAMEN